MYHALIHKEAIFHDMIDAAKAPNNLSNSYLKRFYLSNYTVNKNNPALRNPGLRW